MMDEYEVEEIQKDAVDQLKTTKDELLRAVLQIKIDLLTRILEN